MAKQSVDGAKSETPFVDSTPFVEASAEAREGYGRFNLAIVGNTGVGKSSLVNAVFGRDLAKVGKGRPVTKGVEYFYDSSLGIWDVEGFEIGSKASPHEALRGYLKEISERPSNEQISVVWYCILSTSDRLTDADIEMIRALDAARLPVILVLTKVNWTKSPLTGQYAPPTDVEEFRDALADLKDRDDVPFKRLILTSAHAKNGKDAGHGLGDLVSETLALAPDDDKDAFRVVQRLNLPWKRDMARKAIAVASSVAAATAATPIPVADALALAPTQLAMMGRISTIYELDLKSMLSMGALAQFGAQVAGQALARSFIKLIPGAGNAVNATVAAALTAATGEAWLRLCEQVHTGKLDLSKVTEEWGGYAPSLISVIRKVVEARAAQR